MASSDDESEFMLSFSSISTSESDNNTSSECIEPQEEYCEAFLGFDEDLEPVATEAEWEAYTETMAAEQEQEETLRKRFSSEIEIRSWCKCSHCSVDLLVNYEECWCCQEKDRVLEKMQDVEMDDTCITLHPAFQNICLDRWVLLTAGVGLQTKSKKSYRTLLDQGAKSEPEYLHAVSYRQMVRFVWDRIGSSNRTPLPACVYHAIRKTFPSESGTYRGYEDEEQEEEEEGIELEEISESEEL